MKSQWKWAEWKAGGVGEGWRSIVQPLVDLCEERGVYVSQIKEKFGGLRFYTGPASDDIYEAIRIAENLSFKICERCGKPGSPRDISWIKTLCNDCASKEN